MFKFSTSHLYVHYLCMLALCVSQLVSFDAMSCTAQDTGKTETELNCHDMHSAMGHTTTLDSISSELSQNDNCCDDCSCTMSTCQTQLTLTANTSYLPIYQNLNIFSYSNTFALTKSHTLPYRPPII